MKCFACGFEGREEKMRVAPAILRELNHGQEVKSTDLYRFVVCARCVQRLIKEQGASEDGFRSFKDTFKLLSEREAAAARADKRLGILGAAMKRAGLIKEPAAEASAPASPTTDVVPDLAEPAASPDAQPAPETDEEASGDNNIAQA
jgi:hypothetical protein